MPSDAPAKRRLVVLAHQLQPQSAPEAAPDALRHAAAATPAVVIGGIVMDVQVPAVRTCTLNVTCFEMHPAPQVRFHTCERLPPLASSACCKTSRNIGSF